MRIKLFLVGALLMFFLLPNGICAEEITYEVLTDQVLLSVLIPSETEYRVWHSTNPMKVIVDLEHYYPELIGRQTVNDVALRTVRIEKSPDNIGTRIVLDFNYPLPAPTWTLENNRLIVQIDKEYVQSTVRTISQGVRYGHQRRGIAAGPLIVNYLEVNLLDPEIEIKSVLAQDQIYGREYVSDMAIRGNAIAAVNGLYFAPDGRPLGLIAIDGNLITEPYANRTAIGFKPNEGKIGAVGFFGEVTNPIKSERFLVAGLNRPRSIDELIIYTPDYGISSGTNSFGVDLIVIDHKVVDILEGNASIPRNGVVISGHGAARDFLLEEFEIGDCIEWYISLEPNWLAEGFLDIIGGGPRLVDNGEVNITGEIERFQSDVLLSRAPRTALGITHEHKLLLVTVNGRQPGVSVGVTLTELAEIMIDLGSVDAMNLDGGGSTTMVIRNQVLNLPSDGIERPVSNGIIVINPESRE